MGAPQNQHAAIQGARLAKQCRGYDLQPLAHGRKWARWLTLQWLGVRQMLDLVELIHCEGSTQLKALTATERFIDRYYRSFFRVEGLKGLCAMQEWHKRATGD
jgi:hypothetical protein